MRYGVFIQNVFDFCDCGPLLSLLRGLSAEFQQLKQKYGSASAF